MGKHTEVCGKAHLGWCENTLEGVGKTEVSQKAHLVVPLTFHMVHRLTLYSQRFQRYSTLKCSYFDNELSRKTKKIITRGRVRYLELTEFQLIPRDLLQKKAVFKLLA